MAAVESVRPLGTNRAASTPGKSTASCWTGAGWVCIGNTYSGAAGSATSCSVSVGRSATWVLKLCPGRPFGVCLPAFAAALPTDRAHRTAAAIRSVRRDQEMDCPSPRREGAAPRSGGRRCGSPAVRSPRAPAAACSVLARRSRPSLGPPLSPAAGPTAWAAASPTVERTIAKLRLAINTTKTCRLPATGTGGVP